MNISRTREGGGGQCLSLSALGNVILALANGAKHVPYRYARAHTLGMLMKVKGHGFQTPDGTKIPERRRRERERTSSEFNVFPNECAKGYCSGQKATPEQRQVAKLD